MSFRPFLQHQKPTVELRPENAPVPTWSLVRDFAQGGARVALVNAELHMPLWLFRLFSSLKVFLILSQTNKKSSYPRPTFPSLRFGDYVPLARFPGRSCWAIRSKSNATRKEARISTRAREYLRRKPSCLFFWRLSCADVLPSARLSRPARSCF